MVKPSLSYLEYQQQIIPTKQKLRTSQSTFLKLKQIWQLLVNSLMLNSELRVWSKRDRNGNVWWSAYEPTTGRSIHQISEAEMVDWIEKRHYQHHA